MLQKLKYLWWDWKPYAFTYEAGYARRVFGVGWRRWCLLYYYGSMPGCTKGFKWCNHYGDDCGG